MRITYDTVTDSISSPDPSDGQVERLQSTLLAALTRNEPVQDVARLLLEAANQQ